jgi:hypothetical protein
MSRDNSSFAKVYKALYETEECKSLVFRMLQALDSIELKKVEWNLTDEAGKAQVSPRFVLLCGQKELRCGDTPQLSFHISVGNVIENEEVRQVVNANESKVSSYNCSWDAIKNGRSYGPRGSQQSFVGWFQDKVREICLPQFEAAQGRVVKLVMDYQQTEEFAQLRQNALQDYCIKEVSEVLLRYSHLPKETLKAGVDAYICHEIMDT